jgi:hypothetical protein
MHIWIHIHLHTHTHICIYTYIHTHTRSYTWSAALIANAIRCNVWKKFSKVSDIVIPYRNIEKKLDLRISYNAIYIRHANFIPHDVIFLYCMMSYSIYIYIYRIWYIYRTYILSLATQYTYAMQTTYHIFIPTWCYILIIHDFIFLSHMMIYSYNTL